MTFGPWGQSYIGYTCHAFSQADDGSRHEIYAMARDVETRAGLRPLVGCRHLVKGTIESAYDDMMSLSLSHGVSGRVYLTNCLMVGRGRHR